MAGNSFGTQLRFTTFGESHGSQIGCFKTSLGFKASDNKFKNSNLLLHESNLCAQVCEWNAFLARALYSDVLQKINRHELETLWKLPEEMH